MIDEHHDNSPGDSPGSTAAQRVKAALVAAQKDLRVLQADPAIGASQKLLAAQFVLILRRIEQGIPPGQAAIGNLIRVSVGGR